jgi:hypothetical protein
MGALSSNATLIAVWPHLAHQKSYVSGALQKMRQCNSAHGNSQIRIGILGSGQKPYYRITFLSSLGQEEIFGSFYDNHDPLENGFAKTGNWSTVATGFDELLNFYADAIGHKGTRS